MHLQASSPYSLSLELEFQVSWLENETFSDPMDSIPPCAQVELYKGNRFVLVVTNEEVGITSSFY